MVKLFKEYNINTLDKEIGFEEHLRLLNATQNVIDISKKNIDLVNKYAKRVSSSLFVNTTINKHLKFHNRGFSYLIFELKDEWILISRVGSPCSYYLCDQLEGLDKFLNDKIY